VHRLIRFGKSNLSWGGGLRFTTVTADSINGQEGLFTGGVFLDEQYNLTDRFLVRLAGRLDYHEETGYHFSPRGGMAYQIHPQHTVKASVNVGYRNPTLADNYFDLTVLVDPGITFVIKGNRDLKPEESVWYEAGYQGQFIPGLTLGLDLFYVVTDNFIRSTMVSPFSLSFVNADVTVEGGGGELWGQYELTDSLRLIANYAYAKYQENSEENESTTPNKVNAGLLFRHRDRLHGALTFHYMDHAKWPFQGGLEAPMERDSYYTLNLMLGYQMTRNFIARLEAYNFTNNKHRELPVLGEEIPMEVILSLSFKL
jgi:outer membrane receptor protein involved in Fe transport